MSFIFADEARGADITEQQSPASPFLWKVESDDIQGDVYFFGTIHFSDHRVVRLNSRAEAAFVGSQRFYTELDLSGRDAEKLERFVTSSRKVTLSELLGEDIARLAREELKHLSIRITLENLSDRKIWALWSTLSHLVNCGEGKQTMDKVLHARAVDTSKSVIALESIEEQLSGMNTLSEGEQRGLVYSYLIYIRHCRMNKRHPSLELFSAYLEGDSEKMSVAVSTTVNKSSNLDSADSRLKKVMFTDRNKRLAKKIELELLKHPQKNHFFAIGVGHYLGENSIINLLSKRGYQIQRIK